MKSKLHLENMTKLLILIIFLFSNAAFGVDDETFFLQLNKCVVNQYDMMKPDGVKILTAPALTVICSRGLGTKIRCKVMEKEGTSSSLLLERDYEVAMTLGDTSELKGVEEKANSFVVNRKLKKAIYYSRELGSQTLSTQVVCSGSYKDSKDVRDLIKPSSTEKKTPAKPTELTPSLIGE